MNPIFNNVDKEKFKGWLKARENKVPSGIGDPFGSSARDAKRLFSILSGDAISRKSQQESDLASIGLFDKSKSDYTYFAKAFRNSCSLYADNNELACMLILFLEALKRNKNQYIEIVKFWMSVVKVIGFEVLKDNILSTYLLSRMTAETSFYKPFDEIWGNINKQNFSDLNYEELQAFIDDESIHTIYSGGCLWNNYYTNWKSREPRTEMFKAFEIMFSNDKAKTLDKLCSDREKELMLNILNNYKNMDNLNVILYGPPGTGKTYNTINMALECIKGVKLVDIVDREVYKKEFDDLTKSGQIRFVTFHQSYSYEDFVEGIKAVPVGNQISYEPKDGIFKEICNDARKEDNKNKNFVLIIDEINRGNISNIFGELITLLEPSKREGSEDELVITLPYSGEKFSVPSNLYIIGTMNSADKSISLMDTALRRRFNFVEFEPKPDKLKVVEGVDLKELLNTINRRIEVLLDKDHRIGHAYLMNVSNKEELRDAFVNKIIPLVEEYFYNDYEKIRLVFGDDEANGKSEEFQIYQEDRSNYNHKVLFGRDVDGYDEKKFYTLNKALFNIEAEAIPVELFTKIFQK